MRTLEERRVEVSRNCYECGRAMVGRRENYQYNEVGLKSVTLTNVLVFHCQCGSIVAELPAVGQLHSLIALDLLQKKSILFGEEVRFLRKWVGYSATELADTSGYSKTIISKWENGRKKIGREADRLIRLVVFAKMLENTAGQKISVDGKDLPNTFAELARLVKSLNLPELLKTVENKHEGPMKVRIDPSILSNARPSERVQ